MRALAHLELRIDSFSGWDTLGGITPDGLRQLLQTCRSLDSIAPCNRHAGLYRMTFKRCVGKPRISVATQDYPRPPRLHCRDPNLSLVTIRFFWTSCRRSGRVLVLIIGSFRRRTRRRPKKHVVARPPESVLDPRRFRRSFLVYGFQW